MLSRALDEVKAQIASVELERRLSVVAQTTMGMGGSWMGTGMSSPLDGMSERSSSISSCISSAELSSGQLNPAAAAVFGHSTPDGSMMVVSPIPNQAPAGHTHQLPYPHTNLPFGGVGISTRNLPSAPVYPMTPAYVLSPYTPYIAEPYTASAFPMVAGHGPTWNPYTYMTTDFQAPLHLHPPTIKQELEVAQPPVSMPLDPTAWSFQQSPTSEAHTIRPGNPDPESPKTKRRFSVGGVAVSENAGMGNGRGRKGHKRGVSCNVEEMVREWDAGTAVTAL